MDRRWTRASSPNSLGSGYPAESRSSSLMRGTAESVSARLSVAPAGGVHEPPASARGPRATPGRSGPATSPRCAPRRRAASRCWPLLRRRGSAPSAGAGGGSNPRSPPRRPGRPGDRTDGPGHFRRRGRRWAGPAGPGARSGTAGRSSFPEEPGKQPGCARLPHDDVGGAALAPQPWLGGWPGSGRPRRGRGPR